MKRTKVLSMGLAALAFICVNSVQATLVISGDPVEIGSWGQGFNESGVGNFTQVETIFVSGPGGPFEPYGYSGLPSGWIVGSFSASHVIATGPALNNMTWTIKFLGASSDPLVFDFYAWNGTTLAEAARATYNGGGWSFGANAAQLAGPTPVPEPTTLFAGAGAFGLFLLGAGARSRRSGVIKIGK
jgi:hypothetical protein